MTQFSSKVFRLSALLAGATATLVLVACSGAEEQPTKAVEANAALTGSASTGSDGAAPGKRGRRGAPGKRGRRGPAALLERFDENGDGQLQLSELPERLRERLGRADANGDGVVTPQELDAAMAKRHAERFARADADADGKLTEAEVGERKWRHLSRADADGDGAVSQDELKQAHKDSRIGPPPGPHGRRGRRAFERFDENGDGRLEQSEVPDFIWEHLGAADLDGDGAVTKAELKQARDEGKIGPPPGRHGKRGRRGR